MHNKLLYITYLLILCSCQVKEDLLCQFEQRNIAFTIEEAKAFFEADYTNNSTKGLSGNKGNDFKGKLHPGDFTPFWDKSAYSESDGVAAYDIEILANRSIIAIKADYGLHGGRTERLQVYQKLVVMKSEKSGQMVSYVLSLIPQVRCNDARILNNFRSRAKDKAKFTGIAIYSTVDKGALVGVQEYKKGVLKRNVYLPSGEGSYIERCIQAKEILSGVSLLPRKNLRTKQGEIWDDILDDDNYEEWQLDDFFNLGYGIYTDGDGNFYLDIDEDGDLDLKTLFPGGIVDGGGEAPEPFLPIIPEKQEPEPENQEEITDTPPGDDTPSNPAHLDNVNLFNGKKHFTTYSDSDKNCLKCCKNTMTKMGQTNHGSSAKVIYLVRENDNHTELVHYGDVTKYYKTVTDCINRHLDAGLSIVAGVNHTLGRPINDGTIDHFVLIVGREYNKDTGLYEYIYVETGTDNPSTAQNYIANRLVYDKPSGMYLDQEVIKYTDPTRANKIYTLTELRPNDGETTGTIAQPSRIRKFNFYIFKQATI